MAGGGVQDECVNDRLGVRGGGSECGSGWEALHADAQRQASAFFVTAVVLCAVSIKWATQTTAPRAIAMAGGGVRDECVNNPNGIRDDGSASDMAMDDLKPDPQPWASSLYPIPNVLEWT